MFFCWGNSVRGQLAFPGTGGNSIATPTAVNFNKELVQIACGEQHTLFLTVNGQVLSCGRNSKGQLGRSKSKETTKLPGQMFSWGAGGEGQLGHSIVVAKCPKPMPIQIQVPFQIPVVQVACGNFHSLALTKGGEVISWGQNKFGQLGLGKSVELQPVPSLIRSLVGVPVIQISAGGAHTMLLTLSAQVFCCGANSVGQLGLNRTDVKGRFAVCAVPALRNLGVSSLSCGESHTAVLTKTGEVYTFGEGAQGQLGHNTTNNELRPKKVESVDGPAKQVTCGSHHTLVLMPSGVVFTFGRGVHARINILGEPFGKLEEAQVQKWVTMLECDKSIKEIKKEISWTFATSSNLVASFIKDRDTPGTLQVDVNAASQMFDQLLMIPWIKNSVNITHLVDILLYSVNVMRCPEIFLILPTCSILHEQHNVIALVLPLAVAITNLKDDAMKTLKEHWSSMDADIMTKHIRMWKEALAFLLKSSVWLNFIPGVKAVLKVLKFLYKANKKADSSRRVPVTEFYIEEIRTSPLLLERDVTLWRQIKWHQVLEVELTPAIFCRYPFLLDLESKIIILKYVASITQMVHQVIHGDVRARGMFQEEFKSEVPTPILQLKLRRTALLEDMFRQLDNADHDNLKKTLMVQFVEDAKVTEVNKRDFFLHAFHELLAAESRMFMYSDNKTMIWFPAKPTHDVKRYFLFGILCGLALQNNNIIHLPFPLVLFKKLLGVKPTLDDMIEFNPQVGKSLRYLLHDYADDDAENMNITFTVHWDGADVELDSNEEGKLVTSANKGEFVKAYVDYAFNKSVEQVVKEFRRGFYKACDEDIVNFFEPEELRGVMVGTEQYDWNTFRQNTVYAGQYHERHPTITAFWEVFEELTDEQKKAFLLFLTGYDRVPILGMEQVRMTMLDRPNFTQDHLPESLTCYYHFMIPPYESKQRLEAKLTEALSHNRGFWIEDTTTGLN
ncbi:putative E3 ubiquitin-protein ligase HERC6 [Bagarius yarrelli]|uniref:Putative E3 ubiquitin-protein ligase HERC6 n=1 Tax=Bagarius yarrelli TaxID=175774 RepID=A0A556TMB3_BAGYA|nr:putative E3 ubiquitin-protein ligase HERC6 [Bagarius yarrelli]